MANRGDPGTIARMDGVGGTELRVRLFGGVRVERNGATVDMVSVAHRRMIGRLALNPEQVVSVHALVDLLWPEEPPRTATASVASQMYRLRGIVGADVIRTSPPGYLLAVDREWSVGLGNRNIFFEGELLFFIEWRARE